MPALVVPSTVEARIIWNFLTAARAINVLHFTVPGGYVVNQAAVNAFSAQVTAADAFGAPSLRSLRGANWNLNTVGLRDIRTANQPEFLAAPNLPGTSAGESLPPTVCLCVTIRTALAGKSFRGRVYIPGWTESDNSVNAAASTNAQVAAAQFVNRIRTQCTAVLGINLAVTSRSLNQSNAVNNEQVRDNIWDVQRRRKFPVNVS